MFFFSFSLLPFILVVLPVINIWLNLFFLLQSKIFCLVIRLCVFIFIIHKLFGFTLAFLSVLLLCVHVYGFLCSDISYSFLYISYHPYETWSGLLTLAVEDSNIPPSTLKQHGFVYPRSHHLAFLSCIFIGILS